MGAFKCDTDALNSKVNSNLKNGKNYLDDGANILASISIPSTFSFSGLLSSMPSTIRNNGEKVNELQKWIADVVNKFRSAESANNSVLSGINNNININFSTGNTAALTSETTSIFENVENIIELLAINIVENDRAMKSTNANIEVSYENPITIEETFSIASTIIDSIPALDQTATVICSTFNAITSIVKGLAQLVGALIDAITLLVTVIGSVITGIADIIGYLISDSTLTLDEFGEHMKNGITADMWGAVMGFVSTSFVENAWNNFYEQNSIGQYIDSKAVGIFKHDGIGCNVLSGIGYVGGIVVLTVLTMGVAGIGAGASAGVGTAASATAGTIASTTTTTLVSSAYAAVSAFGKYTGESWAEDKLSSWEGIEEALKNGDISREDYENMKQIRDLSDEEWNAIYNEYVNGNITLEQIETMRQIRNIPEDWKTAENWAAGLEYGGLNALWEGAQWLLGGLLGEITAGLGKVGASIRVSVDSLFNTADTPFRSLITAVTEGKSFGEVFEENGAWNSIIVDALVGLISSGGSEVLDNIRIGKTTQTIEIDKDTIANFLDSFGINSENSNADAILASVASKIEFNGRYNLNNIDLETWNLLKIDIASKYGYNADRFFEVWRKGTGSYGINQGALKDLFCFQAPNGQIISGFDKFSYQNYKNQGIVLKKYATTQEYLDLKQWIKDTYHFSSRDAAELLTILDSFGACSYADLCNELLMYFTKTPKLQNEFYEKFGFYIIEYTKDMNVKINDKKLLLDLYITANNVNNGGKLIWDLPNGTKMIDWNMAKIDSNRYAELNDAYSQQYMMAYNGMNKDLIDRYLKSKNLDKKYVTELISLGLGNKVPLTTEKMKEIVETVLKEMNSGKQISMYITSTQGKIRFIDDNANIVMSTDTWAEAGAHAVYVTGINEIGFIVSSWGEKFIIPFEDLINTGGFSIFSSIIKDHNVFDYISNLFK